MDEGCDRALNRSERVADCETITRRGESLAVSDGPGRYGLRGQAGPAGPGRGWRGSAWRGVTTVNHGDNSDLITRRRGKTQSLTDQTGPRAMFFTILACYVASIIRINFPRSGDECGPSSDFVVERAVENTHETTSNVTLFVTLEMLRVMPNT